METCNEIDAHWYNYYIEMTRRHSGSPKVCTQRDGQLIVEVVAELPLADAQRFIDAMRRRPYTLKWMRGSVLEHMRFILDGEISESVDGDCLRNCRLALDLLN